MSYSVFRIQGIKTTGDLVGISKHNKDRVSHTNQDIDTSRSKDNIILIECDNYNSKFNHICTLPIPTVLLWAMVPIHMISARYV